MVSFMPRISSTRARMSSSSINIHFFKIKKLILIFCAFFMTGADAAPLYSSHAPCSIHARDLLARIPREKKENIKDLFEELFLRQTFSYTLFADKPVSLSDFALAYDVKMTFESECNSIFGLDGSEAPTYSKYWNSWVEFQHLFPSDNFMLKEKKLGNSVRVFLINIQKFKETVLAYKPMFDSYFGKEISPEWLLDQFASPEVDIGELLHHRDDLLGILLGFGSYNPALFQQRHELIKKMRPSFLRNHLQRQDSASKIEELTTRLEGVGSYAYTPLLVGEVYFAGDLDHQETKILKNKFAELRRKLSELYAGKDPLEIILDGFMHQQVERVKADSNP